MLVLKKISAKKLIIYLAIIAVMLSGTGLMLYQNKRLTARSVVRPTPPAAVAEAAPAASPPAAAAAPAQTTETTKPAALSQIKNKSGLDLTIFSQEKFKSLKENASASAEPVSLGKPNPFQPD